MELNVNAGDSFTKRRSSRAAVVVTQQSTESFAAVNYSGGTVDFIARVDQPIVESLIIPLLVIVRDARNHWGLNPSRRSAMLTTL